MISLFLPCPPTVCLLSTPQPEWSQWLPSSKQKTRPYSSPTWPHHRLLCLSLLTHSTPLASWLFFKRARHTPALEILHRLLPHPSPSIPRNLCLNPLFPSMPSFWWVLPWPAYLKLQASAPTPLLPCSVLPQNTHKLQTHYVIYLFWLLFPDQHVGSARAGVLFIFNSCISDA